MLKLAQPKSDGTPVFYNNKMYVTSGIDSGNAAYSEGTGVMQVIDTNYMRVDYNVVIPAGSAGKPLVQVVNNNGNEEVFVFFTVKALDGGLKYIVDRGGSTHGYCKTMYAPKDKAIYSYSNVVADENGNIYYLLEDLTLISYKPYGIYEIEGKTGNTNIGA